MPSGSVDSGVTAVWPYVVPWIRMKNLWKRRGRLGYGGDCAGTLFHR